MIFDVETWTLIAVVAGVLGLFFAIRFARTKGVDVEQITRDVVQTIDVAKIIILVADLKKEHKDRATRVLEIAGIATDFAAKTNVTLTKDESKKLAQETVDEILKQLNITPDVNELALIDKAIELGINTREQNTVKVIKPVQ